MSKPGSTLKCDISILIHVDEERNFIWRHVIDGLFAFQVGIVAEQLRRCDERSSSCWHVERLAK